ncbi:ABC transporter substrate-binding protein [Homoserinimonas hongtaonis]|uniref:Carbohydrate ABC transporter substrate-binding protein n=1 Tax=Homoserinimonas hongtaonis TaxID=2079791 RepID=A0A2U1T241_9MICO|nr:ABC transporter substrate-binding protein [Salinibacterium hongtaonis]AWB88213.1 sugar-binding protein [Salinibacterium hongtaonis]PWB97951.1 carbohydrate ABC transporter substrate-binding protein [Salinibacterium hongtaonis]
MKLSRGTTAVAAVAGAAAFALVAAGCSASPGGENEDIELSITTFGTFGYDDLYKEYEKANPGIKIKATNIDTGGNARTDAFTKIAAGSGLSDIVAIEEGWLGSVMEVSDQFVDLNDFGAADIADRWVDWKLDQGTDADGRVIGYGTDIGPTGVCYNGTLLEAAGMPSDREGVATLLGGDDATWAKFYEVGNQYKAATGKAWYDQSGFVWNAIVNQMPEGYYTEDGELNIEDNAEMKAAFLELADAAAGGLSANQSQWDWGGGKAFVDGTFATFVCPGWMLGVVKEQVEKGGGDATSGWDFADVFPGGAGNWGGAFLSVATSSKHQEEAAALAAWLTAPEQQLKQFEAAGAFPSTTEAQEELATGGTPNEFFNDAPVGTILASRAEGVKAQFKGPKDSLIQENVFGPAIKSLDSGNSNGEQAWQEALTLLEELVK